MSNAETLSGWGKYIPSQQSNTHVDIYFDHYTLGDLVHDTRTRVILACVILLWL